MPKHCYLVLRKPNNTLLGARKLMTTLPWLRIYPKREEEDNKTVVGEKRIRLKYKNAILGRLPRRKRTIRRGRNNQRRRIRQQRRMRHH